MYFQVEIFYYFSFGEDPSEDMFWGIFREIRVDFVTFLGHFEEKIPAKIDFRSSALTFND